MTGAQVLVQPSSSPDTRFNAYLYSDLGGVPGALIGLIGSGLPATTRFGSIVTTGTISNPIPLTSGTQYWLVLGPTTANSFLDWEAGGTLLRFTQNQDAGVNWFPPARAGVQFQIDGVSAPEPSGLLLVGAALFVGLAGAKWRQRGFTS